MSGRQQAFKVLELPADADEKAIKKAYRRLALRYHPDVTHDTDTESTFLSIQEAYHYLLGRVREGEAEVKVKARRAGPQHRENTQHRTEITEEESRSRVRSQLGGLGDRAAMRKRRAAEAEYRAAVRAHTHGRGQAERASTDDAHERIRSQLDDLSRRLEEEAAASAAQAVVLLLASTSAAATEGSRPAVEPEIERLVRLSKLAKEWRSAQGLEPTMGWNFAEMPSVEDPEMASVGDSEIPEQTSGPSAASPMPSTNAGADGSGGGADGADVCADSPSRSSTSDVESHHKSDGEQPATTDGASATGPASDPWVEEPEVANESRRAASASTGGR